LIRRITSSKVADSSQSNPPKLETIGSRRCGGVKPGGKLWATQKGVKRGRLTLIRATDRRRPRGLITHWPAEVSDGHPTRDGLSIYGLSGPVLILVFREDWWGQEGMM